MDFSRPDKQKRLRFSKLAKTFPSLRDHGFLRGLEPWDATTFDACAFELALGSGARCAVQFLLYVWNPYVDWRMGKFDLARCHAVWDVDHMSAWKTWATDPWWP